MMPSDALAWRTLGLLVIVGAVAMRRRKLQ